MMDEVAIIPAQDRATLFREASLRPPHILPQFIEKDFWVCWTLHRLFDVIGFRPHLIFKGGTSLSKVYHVINRFSEDVDLSLSRRDLGFADDHDPEQADISRKEAKRRLAKLVESCQATVREKLLPSLRNDFRSVLGEKGWSVEMDDMDPQTILFSYPMSDVSEGLAYVRPVIRLEMGARSDDWPAEDAGIKPYAAEIIPEVFEASSARVRTLAAERTFWEKATLLHAEAHRPPGKPDHERHARHYYDLARLAGHPLGTSALERFDLLERVIAHKTFFFASSWAHYETARPGTFRLLPDNRARLEGLRRDYEDMKSMIYGDVPPWDQIVGTLQNLEHRINHRQGRLDGIS